MLKNKKYDVIVIGGGIAGYESARALVRGGKTVGLIEKDILGGTALRWGALPIKKILDTFKNMEKDDNNRRKELRERLISEWNEDLNRLDVKIKEDLINLKIDIYFGDGEFINSTHFKIEEEILECEYFIIATGTEADTIKEIPIDGVNVITHKEAINLNDLAKNIIVLGGNVEGVEIAAAYAELGLDVTLVEKEESLLIDNDQDLVGPIEAHLLSRNVRIIKGLGARDIKIIEEGVNIILENDEEILGEKALVTFKRKPNFPKGINNLNIELDGNKVVVNDNLQTHEKNIFAIGDINGILGMAHVAIQQGLQVGEYILNNKKINISYEVLPRAIFTLPEMAGVGRQEWELKDEGKPYKIGMASFKDSWRGWSKAIEEGFVKVILSEENIILGIWMVGENVSEYIGLIGHLIQEEKTVDEIISNLIIHPTLTETILEAMLEGKDRKVIK